MGRGLATIFVTLVACGDTGTPADGGGGRDAPTVGVDGASHDAGRGLDGGGMDGGPSCEDSDGDGHGDSACGGDDCDDSVASTAPEAAETCNAVDDDCDEATDEGLPRYDYYLDCDGDGFGEGRSDAMRGCGPPAAVSRCALGGAWLTDATDCNDADSMIFPGAVGTCDCEVAGGRTSETCNGLDDDCNGTDDDEPAAGDACAVAEPGATAVSCSGGTCVATACAPPYMLVGDRCMIPCGDMDGDGTVDVACGGVDCDDSDPARYPGALEVCDVADVDEDCDPGTYGIRDADSDGVADAACCNLSGAGLTCGTDCLDTDSTVYPGAIDGCDGLDNDCDAMVDEGC